MNPDPLLQFQNASDLLGVDSSQVVVLIIDSFLKGVAFAILLGVLFWLVLAMREVCHVRAVRRFLASLPPDGHARFLGRVRELGEAFPESTRFQRELLAMESFSA